MEPKTFKENIAIRGAKAADMDTILKIYAYARSFMEQTGNPTQWGRNFPPEELLWEDIKTGRLYVIEKNSDIHGVFAFIIGEDKTYLQIENGAWRSKAPYGTIHRIAGDGKVHGILGEAVAFCEAKIPHLRIDTHADNKVMRHLIEKAGFVECGTIYIEDGTPRIAYEKGYV